MHRLSQKEFFEKTDMVNVAQLVRALDCGSKGRGFEPHLSPLVEKKHSVFRMLFLCFLLVFFRSNVLIISGVFGLRLSCEKTDRYRAKGFSMFACDRAVCHKCANTLSQV